MTSKDLKIISNASVKPKKNKLKGDAIIEINDKYLDAILHKITHKRI